MRRYACGVPTNDCCGGIARMGPSGLSITKCHCTTEEAFKCYRRYLIKQGWKEVRSRVFEPPGGGPLRILDKKSKFGAPLRRGKSDDKGGGNRLTPLKPGQCGLIVPGKV
jgi:hypothetical protein